MSSNIIEYKSPSDSITIDDFYKIIAYAALYKGTSKKVNSYRVSDITITMLRESYPRSMMQALIRDGFKIKKTEHGIYEIENSLFRTQIVVTRQLNEKDHIWIKSLTKKLSLEQLKKIAKEYQNLSDNYLKSCAEDVVNVVAQANIELIKKWKEDALMNAAVAELFQPEVAELRLENKKIKELLQQERQAREQERQAREQLCKEKEALLKEIERLKKEIK